MRHVFVQPVVNKLLSVTICMKGSNACQLSESFVDVKVFGSQPNDLNSFSFVLITFAAKLSKIMYLQSNSLVSI